MGLSKTDHPDIVKLQCVFDRRPEEIKDRDSHRKCEANGPDGDEKTYMVYELIEGRSLGKHLEYLRDEKKMRLPKGQFLKWALTMAKACRYIHEECFIMHTDLHVFNWLLRGNGDIVMADFGCAKNLGGPDGVMPIGKDQYYYEGHSSPEMQPDEEHRTAKEFTFVGDTWQLGFAFNCMINENHWGGPTPTIYGEDVE